MVLVPCEYEGKKAKKPTRTNLPMLKSQRHVAKEQASTTEAQPLL